MNFKKFAVPAILVTGLLLGGCSEDEKEPVEKDTVPVETDAKEDAKTETPAEETDKTTEIDVEEDANNENAAVDIFLTYFEGINEEDASKIQSVYNDEASVKGFEELFTSYDIKTEVESYEVASQEGTVWTFDAKVKFVDESGSEGYSDNQSAYEIKVDTATGKITYLEITGTQDI